MSERLRVSVNGDKYTVIMEDNGSLRALRYGEEWQDLCGNNLVYWLAVELEEARKEIAALNDNIKHQLLHEQGVMP